MSMTLWLHTLQGHDMTRAMTRESEDHNLMHELADDLDFLCERLGVAPLSSFFDLTDMEYNVDPGGALAQHARVGDGGDDDGEVSTVDAETGYAYGIDDMQWFDAAAGLATLQALREEIDFSDGLELHLDQEEQGLLLDELDDCIARLHLPAADGGRFHLAVLM
ncbi:MAG TPA: hypothetical protein VH105_04235 [Burkholderiales bacterium]|nr:hypothetical protein [Burkholderiales bacterium]